MSTTSAHRCSIVGIAAWAVCACGKSQEPEIAQLAERELEAGAGIHAPVDEGKTTDAAAGRRSTDLLGGATWALPGPALQFQVGPVDPEPDKVAQSVPLTNGNVLAAYYRTDGYAVWAWYLELAPSDSGWRPVAVLYHEFLCVSFDWHGEGSLTGAVTVDPQVDQSVRCALDLKTGAGADCSLSFRVDPMVDSQPLRDYLSRGLVESLGRSMR